MRLKYCLSRSVPLAAICCQVVIGQTFAQSIPIYSAGEFEVQLANTGEYKGIDRIQTTASMIAKATEVLNNPSRNTNIGGVLTFAQSATGLSRDYVIKTLQSGAWFTFDDDETNGNLVNFDNAISVGDINNHEDDDWSVTVSSPVQAFGVLLKDNSPGSAEYLTLHDQSGALLESIEITTSQINSQFIGVITDYDFYEIRFDEGVGGDDMAIANFRFPSTTEIDAEKRYPDQYGHATDITPDGKTAVVAARGAKTAGLVYVHDRDLEANNDWGIAGILVSPEGVDDDNFGHDVAISANGNTIVVSAPNHDLTAPNLRNAGAAYIYERNQGGYNHWGLVKKLSPLDRSSGADASAEDLFGRGLDIDDAGETIVIGSPGFDGIDTNRGLLYDYRRNTGGPNNWGYHDQLDGGGSSGDRCGHSVAVSGNGEWYFAGCTHSYSDTEGADNGRIAVFTSNGSRKTNLEVSTFGVNQRLGESVATNYDGTVLAATSISTTVVSSTITRRRASSTSTSWQTGFKQSWPHGDSCSVSSDGEFIAIGDYHNDSNANNAGDVFIYESESGCNHLGYCYRGVITENVVHANRNFGSSVALTSDGAKGIIGAAKYFESDSDIAQGQAFLYQNLNQFHTNWALETEFNPGAIIEQSLPDDLCVPIKTSSGKITVICL